MESFLKTLLNVHILNCNMTSSVLRDSSASDEKFRSDYKYWMLCPTVVSAINVNNTHWMALIICPRDRSCIFLDPLGNEKNMKHVSRLAFGIFSFSPFINDIFFNCCIFRSPTGNNFEMICS